LPLNDDVITANHAWGEAREVLGRARAQAEAQPSEQTEAVAADALDNARKAWADWIAAMVAADMGPMPYGADRWDG
jgi:hypothetical protein